MKRSVSSKPVSLAVLALVLAVASQSFAAVIPLNVPQGMAVAPNGNLYVACFSCNQVLVYNPKFVQLTARTISRNVSFPTGVAFDSNGNFWVANAGSWSVTKYTSAGVPTAAAISNGVKYPTAVAVDSLNDVFVVNDFQNYNVYDTMGNLVISSPTTDAVNTLATRGEWTVIGWNNNAYTLDLTGPMLANTFRYVTVHAHVATAAALDSKGNAYVGATTSSGNVVEVIPPGAIFPSTTIPLSYAPAGIAVDPVRSRLFISDAASNKIEAYSIASANFGTLITTIY